MRFCRLWQGIKTVGALALALFCLLFVWSLKNTRLSDLEGKRSYYLYSASSQAEIKSALSLVDFFHLQGESVAFAGSEEDARAVLERYGAQILWEEEACGVRSYYGFVPTWTGGTWVQGRLVNLHVAVGNGVCAVGSPIIFGGF